MKPVILRPATVADLPRIQQWHREQNERDGTDYPLTLKFYSDGTLHVQSPVALVAMCGDEPVSSMYVERSAELMFAGCDPKATAFARHDIEHLKTVLSWQGYRGLHCDVPLSLVDSIRKPLEKAGFHQTDDRLAHFYQSLEG